MSSQALVTAVVREATVLIAQLATAGRVRAPLAHVANQVFVDLARELEAQGVGRKVSADLFGMALRAYQRKLKRLTGEPGGARSLWGELVEHLHQHGPTARAALVASFSSDDEATVRAVLRDLVEAGVAVLEGDVYRAAHGDELLAREGRALEALLAFVAYREGPLTLAALASHVTLSEAQVAPHVEALVTGGRLERDASGRYLTRDFSVQLGAEIGWEAAVLDHVRAVVRTIGKRLSGDVPAGSERIGGSTYSFDVWDGHPLADEVERALERFRREHGALRARVDAHNASQGRPSRYRQVVVYGGQHIVEQGKELEDENGG